MSETTLTARQRGFLGALIQLWREAGAPVHYSRLAETMGVSRFSAYDMLRVLEAQGLVEASYALGHGGAFAGRSSVFYAPSEAGLATLAPIQFGLSPEWSNLRSRLLGQLEASQESDRAGVMDALLGQIGWPGSPIEYCSQVLTALLLNLSRARRKISGFSPIEALKSLTSAPAESVFALLAGLSLGVAMDGEGEIERSRSRQLLHHFQLFQERLREVGEDGKHLLSEYLQDAVDTIVGASTNDSVGKEGDRK